MVAKRNRRHQRAQMGRLALRPDLKRKKDYRNSPVYTRFLTTSYKGQLLEITFTTNLTTEPELKEEIDHIMDSVRLED